MTKFSEMLSNVHGRHVYIQTHNFPDPDAISSAYGLQKLLAAKGIASTICYVGKIDRHSMNVMLDKLDIEIVNVKDIKDMSQEDEIILVDAQKGNSNIVDIVGDEIICIDHHPTYEKIKYRYSDIRPEVGACASIIASYFFENDIAIDKKTATALLYGIRIDTANMTRGVCQLDLDMFYKLYNYSDREILDALSMSSVQYEDLRAYATAIETIKIYGCISFANTGRECPEPLIASISDFVLALSVVEFSVVYSLRSDGIKLSVRSGNSQFDAGVITNLALKGIGSGGGHPSMAGGFVPYNKEYESAGMLISDIENRFIRAIAEKYPDNFEGRKK